MNTPAVLYSSLIIHRSSIETYAVGVRGQGRAGDGRGVRDRAGGRVVSFRADVREHARAAQVVEEAVARLGRLDILVNAAGVTSDAPLWEMTEEQWRLVLDTNLKGAFSYTQAAARHFRRARSGRVVNVASIEATRGRFGLANYAASKAGLVALTRAGAAAPVRQVHWQWSEAPSVRLGVRDKNDDLEGYEAAFVVTAARTGKQWRK